MEKFVEEAHYNEMKQNYYSREVAVNSYNEIKLQLDDLWDEQLELFYEIQAKNEANEAKVINLIAKRSGHDQVKVNQNKVVHKYHE